ncbi:MAG TPA: RagB/SusD family nutrient uptake outer membrane protein [Prolixibacteraceae bacterium]|nr:RagB/SusD family nutrient uptake outer membrane protein [Prolixibacteraceae bacterium]HPS11866.1 RagB/SusD family nutrient uptake outer membrane protein [Prolixibacteraceae bacterium]
MKNIKYIIIFLALGLVACDDFLDRAPDVNLDEEKVFTNFVNAQAFQADIYSGLQNRFNALGSYQPVPLSSAADESESYMGYHGTKGFNMGTYDGLDANISHYYTAIRKANLFLKNVERIPFPDEGTKNQMVGEVFFLRAFFYTEIIKRFGGMPILTEEDLLVPGDDLMRSRDTYRDCFAFIMDDLKKAIDLLPVTLNTNEYGRTTKGAAMALKARLLLFSASPLFSKQTGIWGMNGDIDNWYENDGKSWWLKAAEAAKAVIDLRDNDGNLVYELYQTGATNKADDYENLFFKRREHGNKEIIFYKHEAPVGFDDDQIKVWMPSGEFGGDGAVQPTQNFVDLFEMANGKYINEAGSGYDESNPYINRDPRFYKIILYQGSKWQGATLNMATTSTQFPSGTFLTGYFVRKYVPEEVKKNSSTTAYHNWIYFRLAEMYLNYAEAMNEAEGPTQRVRDAVNTVRARSGVVNLPEALTTDKKSMRERIQNERAIELCFEEHRWWDARRWSTGDEGELATKWFGRPMERMVITSNGSKVTYSRESYYTRIFQPNNNLYQIPLAEMYKNTLLVQNPGY